MRPPEFTAEHLANAAMESNLLNISFSNRNPNGYMLETLTINLVQGTPTYTLPSRTLAIAIIYLTTNSGAAAFDRPLGNISNTDYAAISNKATQGPPTSVWFNLLPTPTLTFWPTPDGNGPYVANVQSFRQGQDIVLGGGQTLEAPYRFLDAFTAGLAYRLSRIYKPELTAMRKQEWEEAWQETAMRDQQDVNMYFCPGLSHYFL
jgi:hypothetical protein